MSAISAEFLPDKSRASRAIVLGGVAAGVLDISAAFINAGLQQGRSPMFVLQSVASGLLGSESYKGGLGSAALGTAVHFSIASGLLPVAGAARPFTHASVSRASS